MPLKEFGEMTTVSDGFLLATAQTSALEEQLRRMGVYEDNERILDVSVPGDGNMNVVRRIVSDRRSLVVKQSVPYVAKYPQFAAPEDRALRERDFYRLIMKVPVLARQMPKLLGVNASARMLALEDLGPAADLTSHYRGAGIPRDQISTMAAYLTLLHHIFRTTPGNERIRNHEMRALNEPHLFQIPLAPENGLDLDAREAGLQALAEPLKQNSRLVSEVRELGEMYYRTEGECLLHGDYFLGCMLAARGGLRIIDAEFCFFGPPEFDVGVLVAHLLMARQSRDGVRTFTDSYQPGPGWRPELMAKFAGTEILRRLLGYAQIPVSQGLSFKKALLDLAGDLVLTGDVALIDRRGRLP